MSFGQQASPDGHGSRTHEERADDAPYGSRSLGATADTEATASPVARPSTAPFAWMVQRLIDATVQREGADVHGAAAHGTRGGAAELPHLDAIQRSFGRHDVGGIAAHVGGPAREGAEAMGAEAFATGNHVAFAAAPSLHTAAHEAAHVVQQRAGVHLKGGVGEASDVYERQADAVADRVVAGQSAEDLLDEHGHAPAGGAAHEDGDEVQRLIATTPGQLAAVLQDADPAQAQITTIGQHITTYNAICNNDDLTAAVKTQRRLDQLRVLDRSVHAALTVMSSNQFELKTEARGRLLHQVLQQSEVEHRLLVDAVVGSDDLRAAVDCFDVGTTTANHGDIGAAQARLLWTSLMDGAGKIKLLGSGPYQSQVRSWLTKLMDTKQGRRMLQYLNSGDPTDLGTNVYIGELVSQLPPAIAQLVHAKAGLKDPNESVAQPILNVDTNTTRSPNPIVNSAPIHNGHDFNEAVLGNAPGVSMNGVDYGFGGGSSGSLVTMKQIGQLHVASGVDRNDPVDGQPRTPEIYQPDWLLLGHELGHSMNMRAGSTTNAMKEERPHANEVFTEQLSGIGNRQARTEQWYGGSEEFLNITGNENELRAQSGLSPRDAHTAPEGRDIDRNRPALNAGFNEGVWQPMICQQSRAEMDKYLDYVNVRKPAIQRAYMATPRDPQHIVAATTLGTEMVDYYRPRHTQRTNLKGMVRGMFGTDGARGALDGARDYEQTLIGQYDHVKGWIDTRLNDHPDDGDVYTMASRIVYFCQQWKRLRDVHDAATPRKQSSLRKKWNKAKAANHSVGTAITADDAEKYNRKYQRIVALLRDYR